MGGNTCISCDKVIGKSGYRIKCRKCNGWSHLSCTNIKKEDAIQKKDLKWICNKCEDESSDRSSEEDTSDEVILKKLHKHISQKKKKSPAKDEVPMSTEEMFKKVIDKITDLEQAITFNGDTLDELKRNFDDLRKENRQIKRENEKLKADVQELKVEVSILKSKAASAALNADLQSRKKNLIILGTQSKEEIVKVLKNLEINVVDEDIKVKPIPSKSVMKPFVVTFNNEATRNMILLKRKTKGNLNSKNMNLDGFERNIYINEDLPMETRRLLKKAYELKEIGYKYIWVKDGIVFCRLSDSSRSVILNSIEHIDQLKEK